jgi:hypothetical protein
LPQVNVGTHVHFAQSTEFEIEFGTFGTIPDVLLQKVLFASYRKRQFLPLDTGFTSGDADTNVMANPACPIFPPE